ncbi:MAG: universal stress protein, partial [Magnetococcales bacterium]|nr:universal stress protein [Magnetococcales bacterium]
MKDDADVAGTGPFRVILLATDGSEFSAGVERVGIAMAAQHRAHLFALRLLLADAGTDAAIVEEQEAALGLEQVGSQCAEMGVQCTPLLKPSDDPSQGILQAAREVGAQLIVLGRRGRRGLAKMMVGEATSKVLDKAGCSVLVVPRLCSYWDNGVLLAVDALQPEEGDPVAQAAFRLAQAAQLPLTILTVVEEDEEEEQRRASNQAVNRLVAMANLQGVEATGLVQAGEMDPVTLEVARQ